MMDGGNLNLMHKLARAIFQVTLSLDWNRSSSRRLISRQPGRPVLQTTLISRSSPIPVLHHFSVLLLGNSKINRRSLGLLAEIYFGIMFKFWSTSISVNTPKVLGSQPNRAYLT